MKDGKQMDAPTTIYEDNQGAIELAKNVFFDEELFVMKLEWFIVGSRLPKGLPKPTFEKLRNLLGVHDIVWW